MMVDIWLFRLFRLNDIWIRFESTCDNHQVWSKGADRDDVYTEGREAWDKGKLSGGKGGKNRRQIASGQLDGWNHFLASDFYSVRDYLKSNPNTKQYETFKFYYCGEDYKYPKEEWTKV